MVFDTHFILTPASFSHVKSHYFNGFLTLPVTIRITFLYLVAKRQRSLNWTNDEMESLLSIWKRPHISSRVANLTTKPKGVYQEMADLYNAGNIQTLQYILGTTFDKETRISGAKYINS